MSNIPSNIEFKAVLERQDGTGTWTYVTAPINVAEVFGNRGRVTVRGKIDRHEFRGSLMPHGDGRHFIVVNNEIRTAIAKSAGDLVSVQFTLDDEPRTLELPEVFAQILREHRTAQAAFDRLSYSHRKEYVQWIESAKKPETRERRAHQAMEMIVANKRLK
jgi:Domain of unknown function (DUF1905)/Bacteriocin-protection, YdeI or OmpD-Associated